MICNKCGFENTNESLFCSKCGNKLSEETNNIDLVNNEQQQLEGDSIEVKVNNKKSKKKPIIVITILLLSTIIGGSLYYKNKSEKKLKEYGNNLSFAVLNIIQESARAETMTNTYADIWSRIIKSDYSNRVIIDGVIAYDFSTGIALQKKYFEKQGEMNKLKDGKKSIEAKMKTLNHPPKKYEEAYKIVFEMYGYYTEYESLAESPNGSLVSFNEKRDTISDNIVKKSKEFDVKIPTD